MSPKNYTPIDDLIRKYKREKAKNIAFGIPKEVEPVKPARELLHLKEAVEHQPEEEVREFVQPRAETIKLPPDIQKIGALASTATNFPTYEKVKIPISDEKVVEYLKKPITTSARWLAVLSEYLLAQAHLVLKVLNGKVTRAVKT